MTAVIKLTRKWLLQLTQQILSAGFRDSVKFPIHHYCYFFVNSLMLSTFSVEIIPYV